MTFRCTSEPLHLQYDITPFADKGKCFDIIIVRLKDYFTIYYRPHTKFAKVMILHLSVILFTRGCGGIPACLAAGLQGGGIPACLAGFQAQTQGGS